MAATLADGGLGKAFCEGLMTQFCDAATTISDDFRSRRGSKMSSSSAAVPVAAVLPETLPNEIRSSTEVS